MTKNNKNSSNAFRKNFDLENSDLRKELTVSKTNTPDSDEFKEHKEEVKSVVTNSIRTITYISFVIGIGLSLVTTVVVGVKAESWKSKGEIIALVFAIIGAVTLSFMIIILLVWYLYFKNSSLHKNKHQKKLKKLKDEKKLKEFEDILNEKEDIIKEIVK